MINVNLKGTPREFEPGTTVLGAAKAISEGLARNACAGLLDGELTDLRAELREGCALEILTFEQSGGKWAYRHTAAHMLAQAVKRLYPDAKLAIGPAIENGFYYDFEFAKPIALDDLAAIEGEMRKIAGENLPIERFTLPRNEALALAEEQGEPYKAELIADLPEGEEISFYRQGGFTDLCAGPHLMRTKDVKAVKLTSLAGAYWRGSEKNKMLTRIYGTAFPKQSELDEYLARVEEAKRRDHNKLGRELEYFTTVDYVGQGLPILMPKGAKVVQLMQRFVEDEEERRGYLITKTPFLAKRELYKISGHWDHYREGMFVLGNQDDEEAEVFALRPMTCPFQFQVYLAKTRSYRDLPLRYNETSTLFRNEASGEMHGLIRVRQFTISEGHLACMPEQLEEEFRGCVDLANFMLKAIGLDGDVSYRFSKWDPSNREKYIGDAAEWEAVQAKMAEILDNLGLEYEEAPGDAAFYGPKLDVQIKNVHGKEDSLITIQIDFQLAERFGMEYVDRDGSKKHPYVIHRTSIGCYERTLALLIEKFAGALPLWLAPVQAKVLSISEKFEDYGRKVAKELRAAGVRVEEDFRNEKIGFKIREARGERVPYILIAGEKEQETGTVSLRSRKGDEGGVSVGDFLARVKKEIDERTID